MHAHDEANHVDCFLYIRFPIATLFTLLEVGDGDIRIGLAGCRIKISAAEDNPAGVLCSGEEVNQLLLLLVDKPAGGTCSHFDFVSLVGGPADTFSRVPINIYGGYPESSADMGSDASRGKHRRTASDASASVDGLCHHHGCISLA